MVARADYVDLRHSLVDVVRGDFSQVSMGLLALITRAQGFFDGALKGVENDNPYATFPLIRCYAENAAVLLWILDHPNDLSRLSSSAPADERFAIGRLISNAANRAKGSRRSMNSCRSSRIPWRRIPPAVAIGPG
jgi:hypothetical protein